MLRIANHDMIVWYPPACGIELDGLIHVSSVWLKRYNGGTVLRHEHKIDSTTCLSGQVARYVSALTPFMGRTSVTINDQAPHKVMHNLLDGMYIDLLANVRRRRTTSVRLFSRRPFVGIEALQPTPLVHIE